MTPRNPAAMDTNRLRAIQTPRTAHELLHDFASRHEVVLLESREFLVLTELPVILRRIIERGDEADAVWVAHTEGVRIRFFSATPSLEMSRERRRPVLSIRIHDECGTLLDSLTSVYTLAHDWQRCA